MCQPAQCKNASRNGSQPTPSGVFDVLTTLLSQPVSQAGHFRTSIGEACPSQAGFPGRHVTYYASLSGHCGQQVPVIV